ncbi:MAG: pentapeptide repeat-containing protein, partial [Pseudomonadota bacterium]
QMQGADLRGAQMQGADLRGAQMQGADLRGAQMQGAVLSGARMVGAACSAATLRGAALQAAMVLCNLDDGALEHATGDDSTWLPTGVTIASCLVTLPDDLRRFIDRHPVESDNPFRTTRQAFLNRILCGRDDDGNLIERPETILGTWDRRDDGAWVDGVTGYVYAPDTDGVWPSYERSSRERRALRERLREEANPHR